MTAPTCRQRPCHRKPTRQGLCRRHYDVAPRVNGSGTTQILWTVGVSPELAGLMSDAAAKAGITLTEWRRRAYRLALGGAR